jgi:DNA-directed RNA polymerase subunit RPC12/RpoP
MSKILCFLCIQELPERTDKNRKPYFICDSCGVQIFVRGRQGITNLEHLKKTLKERDLEFRERRATLLRMQGILMEIRGVEKEIAALSSVLDALIPNERKDRQRELLNKRIETLLLELDLIATGRQGR